MSLVLGYYRTMWERAQPEEVGNLGKQRTRGLDEAEGQEGTV